MLIKKLKNKDLHLNIINWTYSFLLDRTQTVLSKTEKLALIAPSIGSPQGCVSYSITLLFLDLATTTSTMTVLKYADHTIMQEKLSRLQASQ